jgi:uncharacterized protein (TIGR03546 family)
VTLLLKQIFAFFKLLNSDTGANQLSFGLAFGIVLGFSPFLSLQTFLVILIVLFFRVQIGAAFLSAFFFKFIASFLDFLTDPIGQAVLEMSSLRHVFVSLYNLPIIPLTRFNNSIVMGSAVVGFCLVIPAFFLFKFLIVKYRLTVVARFEKTKAWKLWTTTMFYKWYTKYDELYG